MNKHKANWTNPEGFNPNRFLNGQEEKFNIPIWRWRKNVFFNFDKKFFFF